MGQEWMQAACCREIIDLHTFFQGWLDGSLSNNAAVFARFAAATDPRFTLIGPDGSQAGFAATAAWIQAAHGARPGFRLWTTDHTLLHQAGECAVTTYREWQFLAGVTTVRISTAVFRPAPDAPHGVAWLHVHETWLANAP